jgi:type IV pilus biogenesis protein CpaD/CtpE
MNTSMKIVISGLAVHLIIGCATARTPLLTVPAVSMSELSFEPGYRGQKSSDIDTVFCPGDPRLASTMDDSTFGLMDEVVSKAQKESGAKYIAQAQFFKQGNCVALQGVAMK